jgi:polyisoprenoid-binding protein YceI
MSTTTVAHVSQTGLATWAVDPAHSSVEFSVKHMMISTVKGMFQNVSGTVEWDGQTFDTAAVRATVDAASITTFNEMRDNHLRTNDFFNSDRWPHIVFESKSIVPNGDDFRIHGNLTIRDITRPVVLDAELDGLIEQDAFGKRRAAFTATTSINRHDFGVSWNNAIESGGVVVGDKVKITLHIALVRQD